MVKVQVEEQLPLKALAGTVRVKKSVTVEGPPPVLAAAL
jgi:hypothetical protein